MKILILHNSYKHLGGEDIVVAAESNLLRGAGHDVHVEMISNDQIATTRDTISAFIHSPYDTRREGWIDELIRSTGPEIVHIHNFFPLLTPAVHVAASRHNIAVVQTLHNYRLLCANGMFLRKSSVCEKCLGGNKIWGVVNRCYRGSVAGSLAVTRMQWRAARRKTWHRNVDKFIALTHFAKDKFIVGGLPADKIVVKPNFAPYNHVPPSDETREGLLFVGRLSPEKGTDVLLRAFRDIQGKKLTIVGEGPECERLRAAAPGNVVFTGHLSPEQVRTEMAKAQCLVVPSISYESFGMIAVEAFSIGLPVVASRIGALSEIVIDDFNGVHFAPGDSGDLAVKLTKLLEDPGRLCRLGVGARASYEASYTPQSNLDQLENIYLGASDAARRTRYREAPT